MEFDAFSKLAIARSTAAAVLREEAPGPMGRLLRSVATISDAEAEALTSKEPTGAATRTTAAPTNLLPSGSRLWWWWKAPSPSAWEPKTHRREARAGEHPGASAHQKIEKELHQELNNKQLAFSVLENAADFAPWSALQSNTIEKCPENAPWTAVTISPPQEGTPVGIGNKFSAAPTRI
jgi:hypothetical protein